MEVVAKDILGLCAIYTKYFNVKRRMDYPDPQGQFDMSSLVWELSSFEDIVNDEGLYEWYSPSAKAWVKGSRSEYLKNCEQFLDDDPVYCFRQDQYELWEFEIEEDEFGPLDIPLGLVRK